MTIKSPQKINVPSEEVNRMINIVALEENFCELSIFPSIVEFELDSDKNYVRKKYWEIFGNLLY